MSKQHHPDTRRTTAALDRRSRIRPARPWPSRAKTNKGTAAPRAKAAVRTMAPAPELVGGTDDGDGGEHRTGAGDEDQTQAETEDESPAVAPVTAPAEAGEGDFQERRRQRG